MIPNLTTHKAPPLGLQFTETMRGYFSTKIKDDYQLAAQQGKEDCSKFEFTLTVIADDLEYLLTEQNHRARLIGSVTAPAISAQPLTVTNGEFNLFVIEPNQVGTRLMRYRMQMVTRENKCYYLDGFKVIHNEPGFDIWFDTTTLYINVYDGNSASSPILGKGILKIMLKDFGRQLTTIQAKNAVNFKQQLIGIIRFGYFFIDVLYEIYGRSAKSKSSI